MTKKISEHKIQTLIVQFLDMYLPPPFLIYAIPNGGKRDIGTAVKLKNEGVKSGIPDLHVPIGRKGFLSLYVECKTDKGSLTKKQLEKHAQLTALGNLVETVRSVEEGLRVVVNYYDFSKWYSVKKMFEQYVGIK